ncbi:hypothetical protein MHYP_G00104770 [Metynnis hypsauchen]
MKIIFFILLLISVIYRNLRLQDAGLYQCGEAGVWNHTVNFKVIEDPCCLRPNTVSGYLGETVTINCSYPEEFERNTKFFYKLHDQYLTAVINSAESQRGRFSMSDDGGSKELTVKISDVREDDGGVYCCGVGIGGAFISYSSFFTEIQLKVTGREISSTAKETAPATSAMLDEPTAATVTTDEAHFSSSVIIITSCVCVALLLIGGSALIYYKLRHSGLICKRSETKHKAVGDYGNYPPGNQRNISMNPIYQNMELNLVYESLNPIPAEQIQSTRA